MKTRLLLIGLLANFAVISFAVDFPGAGGDLADKDAWGGTLPSSSDGVTIVNGGTYTASDDLSFGSLAVAYDQVVFDFAKDGDHWLTLTAGGEACLALPASADTVTSFKGGVWDFSLGSPYLAPTTAAYGGRTAELSDGCVWTNATRVTIARGAKNPNTTLSVREGARIFSQELFVGYTSGGNVLSITDGGKVVIDGASGSSTFYLDNKTPAKGNAVVVSGIGSSLEVRKGSALVGQGDAGGRIEITDGASAYFSNLMIGNTTSGLDAQLFVGNGATLEAKNMTARSVGGSCVVSNATMILPEAFRVGGKYADGYSNFTFRVLGKATPFPLTVPNGNDVFCGSSVGNVFELGQGAIWRLEDTAQLCYASDSVKQMNTVRIADGARLIGTNTVNFGERKQANSISNTLEIVDGGVVDIPELRLSGIGNRVVIDDGFLFCTNKYSVENQYLRFGYKHPKSTGEPMNGSLTIGGSAPRLLSTSVVQFMNESTLRYEIPQAGYAKDYCPVQSAKLLLESSCALEIAADDWARETGGKLKLAAVTRNDGFENDITNVIKSVSLPADCRLYIEGKSLFLKCPRRSGLSIIVK